MAFVYSTNKQSIDYATLFLRFFLSLNTMENYRKILPVQLYRVISLNGKGFALSLYVWKREVYLVQPRAHPLGLKTPTKDEFVQTKAHLYFSLFQNPLFLTTIPFLLSIKKIRRCVVARIACSIRTACLP